MKRLRIVFMGTPEFAVPMLEALVHSRHEVAAVVTAPDKPAGRGMQLQQSEIKKCALVHGLRVMQPEKLRNEVFLEELRSIGADLFVVVAFRMLPEVVWSMPPMGSINLHASLLPQYRGAAPINWAVINGEKQTGVTTFFIQQEIDTGKIIFNDTVEIGENETAGELYQKLMEVGVKTLVRTVDAIADGHYPQQEQAMSSELKHAPKIFKETCEINWHKTASQVHNFIRGLSPYPAAFTQLSGKVFKIYRAVPTAHETGLAAGSIQTDGKSFLRFQCGSGCIEVHECQLEGKKKMSVEEFLRGNKLST